MPTIPTIALPPDFSAPFEASVSEAFRVLLSEKHLYQSVKVDNSFVREVAKLRLAGAEDRAITPTIGDHFSPSPRIEEYEKLGVALLESQWIPDAAISNPIEMRQIRSALASSPHVSRFPLPTITTRCPLCGEMAPFNPQTAEGKSERGCKTVSDQWFLLSYECQKCKGEPVRFLVRRHKLELTLSGRDPIETVDVPEVLPRGQSGYFEGATVAFQSGQTLAGIFLLRVFIEQYWRGLETVTESVKGKDKPSGDELGEAYKTTLPPDFKSRFPSLIETYGDLSAAMHTANDDATVFQKASADVVRHFEARRLFQLGDASSKAADSP